MKHFFILLLALLGLEIFLPDAFVAKIMAKDITVKVGGDIQSAIDQVSATNVVGRVILEEGTYDLTKTLALKNYVTLSGAGSDKTVLRFSAGNYAGIKNKSKILIEL